MPALKYPKLIKPVPAAWRTTSVDGRRYGGGHTGKLDTLENWEGYRVFRDARSVTGWIDNKGRQTAAIDTHGSALHLYVDGKIRYVKPGKKGGLGGALGSALKIISPAFHALELNREVTGTLFGDQVAEQLQAVAKPVANWLLPGAGELVGYAQTAQRIGEGLAFGDGGASLPEPSFRVDLAGGSAADAPADLRPLYLAAIAIVVLALLASAE